ncbi:hypothetical protein Dsin_005371 [Dipteronia sinensis]|uniref:Uncharacterized protein n=1 Tax=Dipteronia sinensis TaxID=43782 RepID=A0AAE0AXM7_9ROSI|nr:hypothetical protein Dsin_005371 [Dipteronia sinensis]
MQFPGRMPVSVQSRPFYICEVGRTVRRYTPLQVQSWREISRDIIRQLILCIHEKFILTAEPHVDQSIENDLKHAYKMWRYKLHRHCLQFATANEVLAHVPVNVKVDD